jgi:hypothetical protein
MPGFLLLLLAVGVVAGAHGRSWHFDDGGTPTACQSTWTSHFI